MSAISAVEAALTSGVTLKRTIEGILMGKVAAPAPVVMKAIWLTVPVNRPSGISTRK